MPTLTFAWSMLPTWPIVARHSVSTRRISPEGSRRWAYSPSLAMIWAPAPALRAIWPPLPGRSSMLWIIVPTGMFFSGRQLPTTMSASEEARIV